VAPLLILLYFLRLKRVMVDISSTLLWRRSTEDLEVNTPFQRLRRRLLMLVQLAVLAALLIAMARPVIYSPSLPAERVAILIDRSGSMTARHGDQTRFEEARRQVLQLLDELDPRTSVMLVTFASEARILETLTTDRSRLRTLVQELEPTHQSSRLGHALRVIEPYTTGDAAGDGGSGLMVYVVTDGRVEMQQPVSLRAARIRYVRIGEEASDNLAITRLAARRSPEEPSLVQLLVGLRNFSADRRAVSIGANVNRVPAQTVTAVIPPAEGATPGEGSVTMRLRLSGEGLVTVRHNHEDVMPIDDSASAWITAARPLHVLLVTPGNPFLLRAIESVGSRSVRVVSGEEYEARAPTIVTDGVQGEGYDVVVFDRHSPSSPPPADSLFLGAIPPIADLSRLSDAGAGEGGEQADEPVNLLDWRSNHPVLQWVELRNVRIRDTTRLALPSSARVLATGPGGAVMATVSDQQSRYVITSFDVLESNWPMQVGFPVFVSNALHWLAGREQAVASVTFQPGDIPSIRVPTALDSLSYDGPVDLQAVVRGTRAVLPRLERVGVYVPSHDVDPPVLPVSMLDAEESDIAAADALRVSTTGGQIVATAEPMPEEWWSLCVVVALALLMVEWAVYLRRTHV